MKPVISSLPRLTPTMIIDKSTGDILDLVTYQEAFEKLNEWVHTETARLYQQDPDKAISLARELKGSANSYSRQAGYQTNHMGLGREIKAKSRLGELVHFKLMSETASYAKNPNPHKQPHTFSHAINLGAVDRQMVVLEREHDQLVLTWKCWDKELILHFAIPPYILKRNITKWSLPVVSVKGFVFSVQESPTPIRSNITAGIDLGRVEPFAMVILNQKQGVVAQYTSSGQNRLTNLKRERLLKEAGHTSKKAIAYDKLGLDSSVLKQQVMRLRGKASRIGESLTGQIAADIAKKASRHQVSLIHLEQLGWATGPKYGSKWLHGSTSNKIEHSLARKGVNSKRVNPKNTSQLCSKCGITITHNPKTRTVWCGDCRVILDRDFNAALNIAKNINKFTPPTMSYRHDGNTFSNTQGMVEPGSSVMLMDQDCLVC